MKILAKYGLKFKETSSGNLSATSELYPGLGEALYDFRHSISEILKNTIQYYSITKFNPPEKNQPGMTGEEEYYKYWGLINDIDYYGANAYSLNLYFNKATLSLFGDEFYELPITDMIDILKEWEVFLKGFKEF